MSETALPTLSDGHRIPLITCGAYDCSHPDSRGKSLGILYVNGMLGRQLTNLVVTNNKREVHLTVFDRLYANPTHDSIRILQTYMQDMELAHVLIDQVPRYRKIVVVFKFPLSEQQSHHLQGVIRARAPIRFPVDVVRKPSKRKRSSSPASPRRRAGNSSSYKPFRRSKTCPIRYTRPSRTRSSDPYRVPGRRYFSKSPATRPSDLPLVKVKTPKECKTERPSVPHRVHEIQRSQSGPAAAAGSSKDLPIDLTPYDENEFVHHEVLTDSPASPDAAPALSSIPYEDQGDGPAPLDPDQTSPKMPAHVSPKSGMEELEDFSDNEDLSDDVRAVPPEYEACSAPDELSGVVIFETLLKQLNNLPDRFTPEHVGPLTEGVQALLNENLCRESSLTCGHCQFGGLADMTPPKEDILAILHCKPEETTLSEGKKIACISNLYPDKPFRFHIVPSDSDGLTKMLAWGIQVKNGKHKLVTPIAIRSPNGVVHPVCRKNPRYPLRIKSGKLIYFIYVSKLNHL